MQEEITFPEVPLLTKGNISLFLREQTGQTAETLRRWQTILFVFQQSLPRDKRLTKEKLLSWRKSLLEQGYASSTVTNYAKCVNRFLIWCGREDLCFRRGQAKNLTGIRFGRLTALYPMDERRRRNVVWHCVCDCGREVDVPSAWLLSGDTASCGCRKGEVLFYANKYYDGTSIEQSMSERLLPNNTSGYTGVIWNRGRWKAQIQYKGSSHFLGSYRNIEDAAEARKRAKERVCEDAEGLLEGFKKDYPKPEPVLQEKTVVDYIKPVRRNGEMPIRAIRSNNTSGTAGVWQRQDKWAAKITWQGKTYSLGCYETIEEAIEARKGAETVVRENQSNVIGALEEYRKTMRK